MIEICVSPVTVYNFEVEDFHTYHVGYHCILVHNADYSGQKNVKIIENKKVGDKFEAEGFSKLKETHPQAETQVRVNPMDNSGNPMKSGGNHLDGIALDSNGNPFITEYKASSTAPYTLNQTSNRFKTGVLNKDLVVVGELLEMAKVFPILAM